jgi:hypothetical protein
MKTEYKSGTFFCPNCGSVRNYSNTNESGWSTTGFIDMQSSSRCKCGDNTLYDPNFWTLFNPKCPYCKKKIKSGNYCMHCGKKL